MKKLELKTSKGIFFLIDGDSDGRIQLPTDIEYQELGRVKSMTEEQFSEVVDKLEWSDGYFMYYRYDKSIHSFSETWTAKQSFESLIKSLGWHLFENPECPNQFCDNGYIDLGYNEKERCSLCEEAEERVFENPILLKKI